MVRPLTGKRIHLKTLGPGEPVFTQADRGQFDTAIVNMAVNASDAMDGEGRLTIAVEPGPGVRAVGRGQPAGRRFRLRRASSAMAA